MADHELEFHGNHLAINVKVRFFPKCEKLQPWAERLGINWEDFAHDCTDEMFQLFWTSDAQILAQQYGFDEIVSEGRSNGWAVPIYGRKPVERAYVDGVKDEECQNVLMNYFGLRQKIKRIVREVDQVLYDYMWEQLNNIELQFLYDRSISARVLQHVNSGAMA